jgi:hypothetical protein
MALSGFWTGVCGYHASPEGAAPIGDIPFSLEITQGWFGRLRGWLTDELVPGMPDRSPMRGQIRGARIRFTMVRSVYRLHANTGTVTLAEYVERFFGKKLDQPVAPHEVHYAGTLLHDETEMEGTWNTLHAPIRFLSDGTWYEIELGGLATTGTWWLRREIGKSN